MSFAVETLVAEFERKNAHLVGPTEAMLAGFVADRGLHARFMNTLAMLEHMGSHKIMATQAGPDIDLPTLKHLAEETRHAFFFKRHANREAARENQRRRAVPELIDMPEDLTRLVGRAKGVDDGATAKRRDRADG